MSKDKPRMVRIQLVVSPERAASVAEWEAITQVSTTKELFVSALFLAQWMIEEKRRGRKIVSLTREGEISKELSMPFLDHLVPQRADS